MAGEYCHEHDCFRELRCKDCCIWVCVVCVALRHKLCQTMPVKCFKEPRQLASLKVEQELENRKNARDKLANSLKELERRRATLRGDLKDCDKQIAKLESLKSEEKTFFEKLKRLRLIIGNSFIEDKVFSGNKTDIDGFLSQGMDTMTDDIQHSELLKFRLFQYLRKFGSVYAMEDRYNGVQYGKVAVQNDRIWISSFQSKKPKAKIFTFKELLFRFSHSSELPNSTFFQVASKQGGGDNRAELVIETEGLSPRSKNFVLLCSGLKGPTYKGLALRRFSYPSSYLEVSPGPTPVLEEIREDEYSITPLMEGGVHGILHEGSGFWIPLEDRPSVSSYKFGSIVSGLQNLLGLEGDCTVTDCGLII